MLTPPKSFAARRGNCLSFTVLFVVLADIEMRRGNLQAASRQLGKARRAARRRTPEVYEALARLAALRGDAGAERRYRARAHRIRQASNPSRTESR
jgi:ATP/maltotriose-dependent transcriptional regulator MalT